ncbi:hypothetical protein, partial [Marivivens sp.]|uniref:hypothetical protein n=1 Tax=Marivivens sp. TaxID=1978374 RepID=UPI0025BF7A3A
APVDKFLDEKGMRLPESVLLQTVTGDFVDDDIYYSLLDDADIDFVCVPDEPARRRPDDERAERSNQRTASRTELARCSAGKVRQATDKQRGRQGNLTGLFTWRIGT